MATPSEWKRGDKVFVAEGSLAGQECWLVRPYAKSDWNGWVVCLKANLAKEDHWFPGSHLSTTHPATPAVDVINHPPHYLAHPSGVECITITEHMGFCLGNAMKYLWRADQKGSPIEDLKKCRFYIDREIARREAKP